LLEYSECGALQYAPLKFNTKTQEIVDMHGAKCQHELENPLWLMVVKLMRLGDRGMTTVLVPVKDGEFDWQTKNTPKKRANL